MNNFQIIKDTVTMQNIVEYYRFKINHARFIKCPFHQEKSSSMKIYPGNRGYNCFGCGNNGSVIDFVSQYENISPYETVKFLNDAFNVGLDFNAPVSAFNRLIGDIRRLTRQLSSAYDDWLYWQIYELLGYDAGSSIIKSKNNIDDILRKLDYCKRKLRSGEFDQDVSDYFDTVVKGKIDRQMKNIIAG